MAGFQDFLRNNNMALVQAGAGLLGGRTANEQAAMGLQGFAQARQDQQKRNMTMDFLQRTDPELAQAVASGVVDPQSAFMAAYKRRLEAQKPRSPLEINGKLVDPNTYQVLADFSDQTTETQRNLEWRAQQAGLQPDTPEYRNFMAKGGSGPQVEVNLPGQPNIGNIPPGYQAIQDAQTKMWSMQPIPGGPADPSKANETKAGINTTASDIVTTAASRAREAAANRNLGASGTSLVGKIPWTDSAEVLRQVDVLKSQATTTNLQAMRDASPTGGALGNVTERELKILSDKSGALDPDSPNFLRDLDDYERTLLRTIHGPEAGDLIYEQTRRGGNARQPGGVVDYREYFGGQ